MHGSFDDHHIAGFQRRIGLRPALIAARSSWSATRIATRIFAKDLRPRTEECAAGSGDCAGDRHARE